MMTIGQVIDKLKTAKPEQSVYFSFARCTPTTVDSWRGIYADPAIGWAPTGYTNGSIKVATVGELLKNLEEAIDGRTFHGWKGGEYSYRRSSQLHIDNRGDYTETEIADVIVGKIWVTIVAEHDES